MTSNLNMSEIWRQRITRNLWWLGGVAVVATFNVSIVASSYWPRLFCYTDGDTLSGILSLGNIAHGVVVFLSSMLSFLSFRGTSSWRRVRLFMLGTVCALFWGWNLVTIVLPDVFPPGWHFPIAVDEMIFQGLLLLWSLALIFAALAWKPQPPRDEMDR